MSARTAAPAAAPATASSDPDFLSLARLDELPELKPFVTTCDELGAQIIDLDYRIRLATERLSALWKGFQGSTLIGTNQPEDVVVTEARQVVKGLDAQRKTLAAQAVIARADLAAATAEVKAAMLPAMAAQLAPPLDAVIAALDAAQAVERLCGNVGGHGQARAILAVMLPYLTAVRAVLGEGEQC